jgi:hypothetical protein
MAFRDMKMKVLLLMPEMIQDHKDWEGAKVAVLNNYAEYEPYLRAASLDTPDFPPQRGNLNAEI